MAAMTPATSLASIGEVRPVLNGKRIVESLAIDSAAHSEKKGCWRKTVGRTLTTGNPDQFSTCSQSHCCRCWGEVRHLGKAHLRDRHLRDVDQHLQIRALPGHCSRGDRRLQ